MSRVRGVGERPNYYLDSDVTLDQEGYCLTKGNDGPEHLRKASGTDTFVGVNHKSTYDIEDEELESGGGPWPSDSADGQGGMAVEQDGWPNMLCASGATYNVGDVVYLSGTAGVADKSSTSNTRVGVVAKHIDLSDESSPGLVPVCITGELGP